MFWLLKQKGVRRVVALQKKETRTCDLSMLTECVHNVVCCLCVGAVYICRERERKREIERKMYMALRDTQCACQAKQQLGPNTATQWLHKVVAHTHTQSLPTLCEGFKTRPKFVLCLMNEFSHWNLLAKTRRRIRDLQKSPKNVYMHSCLGIKIVLIWLDLSVISCNIVMQCLKYASRQTNWVPVSLSLSLSLFYPAL